MKKLIVLLGCVAMFAGACDNKQADEPKETSTAVTEASSPETITSGNLWDGIKGEPANFEKIFANLNDAQKYYFCAAFSVGALSVSKPETASAMVKYFLGLGVVNYNQGIDDSTYPAFDFGKHIFSYELVTNYILENKSCENIVLEATEYAKEQNYTTEALNDLGKPEAEKIILRLK